MSRTCRRTAAILEVDVVSGHAEHLSAFPVSTVCNSTTASEPPVKK